MTLFGLILLTPLFFFPIRDGFGTAKVAYMAILATAAAYRLWRMDGVRISHLWALAAFLGGVMLGMKNVINWYEYLLQVCFPIVDEQNSPVRQPARLVLGVHDGEYRVCRRDDSGDVPGCGMARLDGKKSMALGDSGADGISLRRDNL